MDIRIIDDACGRYTLSLAATVESKERLANLKFDTFKPNYNTAPGQNMPVIVKENNLIKLQVMRWGLIPPWAKDINIGYKLINARAETLFEKPIWRTAVKHKRCLIPATGFYEWKKTDSKIKVPYFIHPRDQDLFTFAGLWSTWKDPSGNEVNSYSIVTTAPSKQMSEIHDRMPVMFHKEEDLIWLDNAIENQSILTELLHPYKEKALEIYKVSTNVNSIGNNNKDLLKAI
jgi:putative SOS response-associated peptidase YedK